MLLLEKSFAILANNLTPELSRAESGAVLG